MKSKSVLLVLAFQIILNVVNAQPPFQKTISGFGINGSNASQKTSDNGYILAGGNSLVKIDSLGNVEWAEVYYTVTYTVILQSVKQTLDGGYIACGMSLGLNNEQDYTVIRTDSIGDTLWTRSYGGALDDWAYAVEITQDSAYIVGGTSTSINGAFILKINDQGDTLWTKRIGSADVRSIKQTSDGNFIIAGNSLDILLIKINLNGDTLWTRSYGEIGDEYVTEVIQTSDGGYAITGTTFALPNAGIDDVYLLKTDSLGNFLWAKSYGGLSIDEGAGLKQTADDGFILAGRRLNNNGGGGSCNAIGWCYDVYLIRTNPTGDTLWSKMYGGDNFDWAYSVETTNDGGFIITGQTESFNVAGGAGAYIIKTNASGDALCNQYNTNTVVNSHAPVVHSGLPVGSGAIIYATNIIGTPITFIEDSVLCISTGIMETVPEINNLNVYPNPFNDKLTIAVSSNDLSEIILFDIASKKLLQQKFTNSISLNTEQLVKGIYLYEVRNKNGVIKKGKVVKE